MENLDNALEYIPKHFKVITKGDVSGASDLVPMELWPSQRHYIENSTNRDVVLKNRQTGFSTGVEARNAHRLFTIPYQRQTLITHDDETSEFLFQTVERFYNNLPPNKRPTRDWASGRRMRFPDIDSYIYIDSAKSDAIGIGHGLNNAHLSEVARWPQNKADQLFADITQTVPLTGLITAESTPRGRQGLFPTIYMDAKKGANGFKAFFYPWWWDVTCVSSDLEWLTEEKADIIANIINESTASLIKHENFLREKYELDDGQIAFRRQKIAELKVLFFQEYPESDIDCWLSSDIAVVDGLALKKYYQDVEQGVIQGNLTTWKDVIGGRKYVIGADIAAGTHRDFSVASVLDTRTLEYDARLRGHVPPDLFAEQLFNLGIHYNEALLAVERAGHGHTVLRVLMEKGYPKLYYHEDYDTLTGKMASEPGWKTSVKTSPMMIDGLCTALRAGDLVSHSENLLEEAAGLVWDGQKIKKSQHGTDDEWDAVCIALQIREQIPILEEKRPVAEVYAPRI